MEWVQTLGSEDVLDRLRRSTDSGTKVESEKAVADLMQWDTLRATKLGEYFKKKMVSRNLMVA